MYITCSWSDMKGLYSRRGPTQRPRDASIRQLSRTTVDWRRAWKRSVSVHRLSSPSCMARYGDERMRYRNYELSTSHCRRPSADKNSRLIYSLCSVSIVLLLVLVSERWIKDKGYNVLFCVGWNVKPLLSQSVNTQCYEWSTIPIP